MAKPQRVGDLPGSRRDVLRLGGLGLLGASIDGVWTGRATASTGPSVTPRGNARRVIFLETNGAISPIDCFDFKENGATPEDLDIREVYPGLHLSHLLFPGLSKHMDKFAVLPQVRDRGLGRQLFRAARRRTGDHFFWRASPDNDINAFYHRECHRFERAGPWNLFCRGLDDRQWRQAREFVRARPPTMMNLSGE